MEGILLVDKPKGWTSFDVVNKIRSIVAKELDQKPRSVKVGHTGTLDPAATGLLVVCIGKKYTKTIQDLIIHDKTYEVEMVLGKVSTTGDQEGEITAKSISTPKQKDINTVIAHFIGEISQKPPVYSAIKINGKRAYELARKGQKVDMPSRKVKIHSMTNVSYDYPIVKFVTRVGSGTYIRSLVQDIGDELNTGAYTSNLRRISVGDKKIQDALQISDITANNIKNLLA